MSYYNLCGIGSQHSNISKGKWGGGGGGGGGRTGMQEYNQDRQKYKCDIECVSLR